MASARTAACLRHGSRPGSGVGRQRGPTRQAGHFDTARWRRCERCNESHAEGWRGSAAGATLGIFWQSTRAAATKSNSSFSPNPIIGRASLIGAHSFTWDDDPWARGGYAFFDSSFLPSSRRLLRLPWRLVFFAGEHTSVTWQGYMNGAVESGLRAAAEIFASNTGSSDL